MSSSRFTIVLIRARSFAFNAALALSAILVWILAINRFSYSRAGMIISDFIRISDLILLLIVTVVLTFILESLDLFLQRYLRGDWRGGSRLSRRLLARAVWRQLRRYDLLLSRVRRLQERIEAADELARTHQQAASGEDHSRVRIILRHELEVSYDHLIRYPARDRLLPTQLGNTLRAVEDRLSERYAISVPVVGPRLLSILPDAQRLNVESAEQRVDSTIQLCISAACFAVLSLIAAVNAATVSAYSAFWFGIGLLVSLIVARLLYDASMRAAIRYGVEFEVAFDLNRIVLLQRLNLERPKSPNQERRMYALVSQMLSGADVHEVKFMYKEETGEIVKVVNVMGGDSYYTEQAVTVGRNARTKVGKVTQTRQMKAMESVDLDQLAEQLAKLRSALRDVADSPERDSAVGAIADAETAARSGDRKTVMTALRRAGKWVLYKAQEIGVEVAATAIAISLGLHG